MPVSVEHALGDVTLFPLWLDHPDAPTPERPLIGRTEADLAVVGGGFTGLWAAIQAKEANPGRDVVLVEASTVAFGASGRPGGIVSTSVMHGLANAVRIFPGDMEELERLAQTFFKTFPQLADVRFSHAWGGPIALSTRMAVHFQRYHEGKAIWAGGYSGFGVSASRFGARVGLALLDDPSAPECKLDLARTLPNMIPPEPFRWVGAKITMKAIEDADERGGWRKAWIRLVHAMGFPL